MTEDTEKENVQDVKDDSANESKSRDRSKIRICLTLAISIMLFKGAETMYRTTINSYLFEWIYENGRETNFTILKIAENTSESPSMCYPNLTIKRDQDIAQKKADKHQTNLLSVASTLSLLSLMFYGCLSDYFGRKIIFIACSSGYIIQICIACIILNFSAHMNYLYIAYIADGLGGSAFGFSLGCFLSLADIAKTKNEKYFSLALIDSLVGIGSITTKFSTPFYLQRTSYNFPILTACGLCIVILLICIVILDDTLYISKEFNPSVAETIKKKRPTVKELVGNLADFFVGKRSVKSRTFFWLCFVSFCLVESPSIFRSDFIPLIQINWPLCWSASMSNLYTFCALGATNVVGMLMLKPLLHVFSDITVGCIGILSAMAFNFCTAEAKSTAILYTGVCAGALMLVPKPIIRGLASKVAGPAKQGALFAGLLAAELICEVVSEIIYKFCYAQSHARVTARHIFLSLGAVLVPCLFIMILLKKHFRSVIDGEIPDTIRSLSVNYKDLQ